MSVYPVFKDEAGILRAATGADRFRWHGQLLDLQLKPAELAEFEAAKQRGWLHTRAMRGRHNLRNIWFSWCELQDHPYVLASFGPKYVRVELDLIGQSWRLSKAVSDNLFSSAYDYLWGDIEKCQRGARICGGETTIFLWGIPHSQADIAAQIFVTAALACKLT